MRLRYNLTRANILAAIITVLTAWVSLELFLSGRLILGDFSQFMLPADRFGLPAQLLDHGLTTFFRTGAGWDGQFYYSMSNDIFALRDTVAHIDTPAYRYQRIGIPLIANIISKLIGQSWVSPLVYYSTSLGLVLLATVIGSRWLQLHGRSPYLILLWSLAAGVQVTILNGLPDAGADALLILALICWYERRAALYVLAMSFAALAREAYVVVPFFAGAAALLGWGLNRQTGEYRNRLPVVAYLLPVAVMLAWQIYVRLHIGSPQTNAVLLTWPFADALRYALLGFRGLHPAGAKTGYFEGVGLILHLFLVIAMGIAMLGVLRACLCGRIKQYDMAGFALGFGALAAMYLCFNHTVVSRYSGYFKASDMFLFALPFMLLASGKSVPRTLTIAFAAITAFFFIVFAQDRFTSGHWIESTAPVHLEDHAACLTSFDAQTTPLAITEAGRARWVARLLGRRLMLVEVKLTNRSSVAFSPTKGAGSVNVGYQWLDEKTGRVVVEGARVMLSDQLQPGSSVVLTVPVEEPASPGNYRLVISPVQEQCAWFYQVNSSSALDVVVHVR
ncbi:hypothetical protein [Burkholderia vietnamiensis]|uniref:hypothetical protein n=1 Tax=Burkholderia vietnamiensis TaxID=60552 RepID=UPI00076DD8BE|nr:hypothetical protein [Burkholderia vietnamiensis]KVF32519.1 hypothetical protein WJ08_09865 [Burkholderia vietnamiensis]HDR9239092.1 hypothetical protein [Burkholderia vietnamiensis]HDR9258068.1 hypothetical protein [Burkholderia vietnamiensis]HEP6279672.1 hypothetical protein [Burkholderia vietnamiensis]HEP6287752.1 hypothetical protein [Burkholderia vietnamiensis]